jgi:hypothetical protein
MIQAQDALSLTMLMSGFGAKRQIHSVHQGREQDLLTPCSHNSSSYVGTGFIGGEDQGYIACP